MKKPDFKKMGGLVPAIVQEYKTNEVLMLAYMNKEAWETTLSSGKATFFSRSRQELWIKGKTSGHYLPVKEIRIDCDDDTILLKVELTGGAACHKGYKSCFYQMIENDIVSVVEKRIFNPKDVYE